MGLRIRRPDPVVICLGCVFVLWLLSRLGDCALWLLGVLGDCVLWLLCVLGDGGLCGVALPDVCFCCVSAKRMRLAMPGLPMGALLTGISFRWERLRRSTAPLGGAHFGVFRRNPSMFLGCRTRTGCPRWSRGSSFPACLSCVSFISVCLCKWCSSSWLFSRKVMAW